MVGFREFMGPNKSNFEYINLVTRSPQTRVTKPKNYLMEEGTK